MSQKPTVLMISKPIAPPWNDSAKNVVRDQVSHGKNIHYRVLTPGQIELGKNVTCDPIYKSGGQFSAGIKQNAKVMLHGLLPRGASVYHYFFAPNTVTSYAGKLQRVCARVKTVQTICSQPASFEKAQSLLFTDKIIVLSEDTKSRFIQAGISPERIHKILPGIEPIDPPSAQTITQIRQEKDLGPGQLIVFPGDFEFSTAAKTIEAATPQILEALPDATLVYACRIKREPSRAIQAEIQTALKPFGNRVRFFNQVDNMPAFVGAADLVILPSESLYAKMDVPLVLLEAMSQKVPFVIADVAPLNELLASKAGVGIPPKDPNALADAIVKILTDKSLHTQYGDAGYQAVRHSYSAASMAAAVEQVYEQLLSR